LPGQSLPSEGMHAGEMWPVRTEWYMPGTDITCVDLAFIGAASDVYNAGKGRAGCSSGEKRKKLLCGSDARVYRCCEEESEAL
jgi:hypothetical protein